MIAGTDHYLVADHNLLQGNGHLAAVPPHAGGLRGEPDQGLDRSAGRGAAAHLQPVAGQAEGGEHCRCLVEGLAAAAEERRGDRVQVGDQDA